MAKKLVLAIILLSSLLLNLLFTLLPDFAEFYTLNIAPLFRIPLSFISSLLPFSLGEALIVILILLISISLILGVFTVILKLIGKKPAPILKVFIKIILYTVYTILLLYNIAFASSYSRRPINEGIALELVEMTESNIVTALKEVTHGLYELENEIVWDESNGSKSHMSFKELSREVSVAAENATKKYPVYQKYITAAKPIAFSEALAYTGISGIYTFFTGESNINTVFRDYTLPFTIAHEYSHQLGIGSEKEAEFSALLICLESEIPYIRYSAYSQAAITLINLLISHNREQAYEILSKMPDYFLNDVYISQEKNKKYTTTVADEVASAVNNAYLKASGDSGIVSYSLSSKLYTAYFQGEKHEKN